MAPAVLLEEHAHTDEHRPSKKIKFTHPTSSPQEADDADSTAIPSHPLHVKPAGNAYTATENIKSHSGLFASLPDELLSHFLETLDASLLLRLGATCKALYAFTRADELWRNLFIE